MADRPHILVLGASGMLGSAVRRALTPADGTQSEDPQSSEYLDVTQPGWTDVLRRRTYGYIINCIGILKPAVNEQDPASLSRAIRVNALFPHELAQLAAPASIIHLSTDGVFSGSLTRPYLESDPTDCPDAYGKSKVLGESPAANVLNIRCSIVGLDPKGGKGLMEWVLRQPDGAEITGFEDHLWNGVTTNQFGELCRRIIDTNAFPQIRAESSVHHFCPNSATTKYDLLCCIKAATKRNLTVRRGRSSAPNSRILGTNFTQLRNLYPNRRDWPSVIEEALTI